MFTWLTTEEEFRGRVRLVEVAPEPGTSGGWPEAVAVTVSQSGAVTILASAVVAWIRHRTSEVKCKLTRLDGTAVEITAARVRSTDVAGVGELVGQVVAALSVGDAEGSREEIG